MFLPENKMIVCERENFSRKQLLYVAYNTSIPWYSLFSVYRIYSLLIVTSCCVLYAKCAEEANKEPPSERIQNQNEHK